MKTITLKADDYLIDTARRVAASEHTTIEAKVCEWLEGYTQRQRRTERTEGSSQRKSRGELAVATARELREKHPTGGKRFTRDEMNER